MLALRPDIKDYLAENPKNKLADKIKNTDKICTIC